MLSPLAAQPKFSGVTESSSPTAPRFTVDLLDGRVFTGLTRTEVARVRQDETGWEPSTLESRREWRHKHVTPES